MPRRAGSVSDRRTGLALNSHLFEEPAPAALPRFAPLPWSSAFAVRRRGLLPDREANPAATAVVVPGSATSRPPQRPEWAAPSSYPAQKSAPAAEPSVAPPLPPARWER